LNASPLSPARDYRCRVSSGQRIAVDARVEQVTSTAEAHVQALLELARQGREDRASRIDMAKTDQALAVEERSNGTSIVV
jgi:hypothetical protein